MEDDKEVMVQLGANIAKLRKKRKLTQSQLAEAANTARRTIQAIEGGESWPRPNTLLQISRELNVPVGKLFSGLE